jgi:hypothetical protein
MNALQNKRPVVPRATRSQAQLCAANPGFFPQIGAVGNLTGFGESVVGRDFEDAVMIADCCGRMRLLQRFVIPVFYSPDKLT